MTTNKLMEWAFRRTAGFCCVLGFAETVHSSTVITLSSLNTDCGTITNPTNAPVESSCNTNAYAVNGEYSWASSSGTTWARAEIGWLRFKAQGDAAAQTSNGSWGGQGNAYAGAYWEDTLTVNAGSEFFGQLGEMTVNLVIAGALGLGGGDPYAGTGLANGAASYFSINLDLNGSYGATGNFDGGTQLRYASGGGIETLAHNGALIGPGVWPVTFPFHFGRSGFLFAQSRATVDARAVVYSAADGLREGHSTSDFSQGVIWAGISQVRGPGGVVLTNFTVTSVSGYNYVLGTSTNDLRITRIQILPQGVALDWSDLQSRSYTVETRTSLTAGSWTPATGVTWPVTTNTVTLPLPLQTNAFFRVSAH